MKDLYEIKNNKDKIVKFVNKKPVFNNKTRMYEMDMNGKAHLPSIKNLVLKRDSYPFEEAMMFAKVE